MRRTLLLYNIWGQSTACNYLLQTSIALKYKKQPDHKEHEENTALFDFLYKAFTELDQSENSVANFHIGFMAQLSEFLGFMIDDNYGSNAPYFDVKEGRFSSSRIANQDGLNVELSEALFAFCQLALTENHRVQIKREDRRTLIKCLMRFYQYNIENFKELNSFTILQEVF